ncbi:uncharacterized protein KIAA1614 isoform X2 [Electrophorus electricus]|uniref:uncharacterized protein KIAA1614 isoform X2 n=1 Tax=Electrophorus electricus TaxID=8005 RepID=UPI0015D09DDD|nr:uncharacterized protein KIAA1614 isoform X2 [Electrophorus electricus]XP_035379066.1 uncharacterized protein KIAA1614 isoform X2 [Electrophorus electricus]
MEEVGVAKESNVVKPASRHPLSSSGNRTENQERTEAYPSSSSWEQTSPGSSSLCPDFWLCAPASQASAVSAKVKALLERDADQKRSCKNLHQKDIHGFHTLAQARTGTWSPGSSDEEIEPHSTVFTFTSAEGEHCEMLPDEGELHGDTSVTLLDLSRALGEDLENIEADDICNTKLEVSSGCEKPWVQPKDSWSMARPKAQLLNRNISQGGEGPMSRLMPSECEELQRSDSLGSHPQSHMSTESSPGRAAESRLGRAESVESSSSSSGGSLSLAERVEMNRRVLRQMLQKAHSKGTEGHQGPLSNQRLHNTYNKGGLNDTDYDSGIPLHDWKHQRAFPSATVLPLSPHHQQSKRLPEHARMKGRSHPLKADHTILPVRRDTPGLLPQSGASKVGRAGVVAGAGSGNLSDSSSSDSTCSGRRRPGHSPTRVRFQDESEKDAEVRYQDRVRQRRWAAERAQGPLGSKPSLAAYIDSRTGEAEPTAEHKSGRSQEVSRNGNSHYGALLCSHVGQQCEACGSVLDKASPLLPNSITFPLESANEEAEEKLVPCWLAATLPSHPVRIERIRETYVGPSDSLIMDSDGTRCRTAVTRDTAASTRTLERSKRRGMEEESSPETISTSRDGPGGLEAPCSGSPGQLETGLLNGTAALPPNPYAPEPAGKSPLVSKARLVSTMPPGGDPLPQPVPPPLQSRKSALKPATVDRSRGHRGTGLRLSPPHRPAHREPPEAAGDEGFSPQESLREGSQVLINHCPTQKGFAASSQSGDTAVRPGRPGPKPAGLEQDQITRASPTETVHGHLTEGAVQGPIRPEHEKEDSPSPSADGVSDEGQRDVRPRLSLRRFFSAIGLRPGAGPLRRGRSSSAEQLGPPPETPAASPVRPRTAQAEPGLLRKTPSLQSLRLGSPFLQLKKFSSVQNLQSPKRKLDRSSAYTPGEEPRSPAPSRGLLRSLSVEDVGCPSALRAVGRVAQVFPDGTLLLELSRPPTGTFGFLISRGKGRLDSGVYVEEMGDSSTQKLYAGLLGVGDEIVEVSGQKVAGLSLDTVTRLMTQSGTSSLRVLRQRPPTPPR